jgi:hypothetical protein
MPFTGNLDRPIRDGSLIKTLTQHFALGYFRRVPPGQLLLAHVFSRYVDADARLEKQPTDLRRRHHYM